MRGQQTINLADEHNNIEYQMRARASSSFSFNLLVPNGTRGLDAHKVTVRLYYFPKLLDQETRPLDKYEARQMEERSSSAADAQPLICCYWEGRWIPYSEVRSLKKVFEGIRKEVETRPLLGRLRGSVFLPHGFLPSNNKLTFQQSPQVALNQDTVRIMKAGVWDEDAEVCSWLACPWWLCGMPACRGFRV